MPILHTAPQGRAAAANAPVDHRSIEVYDREALVSTINTIGDVVQERGLSGQFPELADRERIRGLLNRLGVTEKPDKSYRLVIYEAPPQSAVLIGSTMADGALRLTRMIATPNSESRDKYDELRGLVRNSIRILPTPIDIPAAAVRNVGMPGRGLPTGNIILSPKEAIDIEATLTLLVLAADAVRPPTGHVERGAPADLPLGKRPPGRSL